MLLPRRTSGVAVSLRLRAALMSTQPRYPSTKRENASAKQHIPRDSPVKTERTRRAPPPLQHPRAQRLPPSSSRPRDAIKPRHDSKQPPDARLKGNQDFENSNVRAEQKPQKPLDSPRYQLSAHKVLLYADRGLAVVNKPAGLISQLQDPTDSRLVSNCIKCPLPTPHADPTKEPNLDSTIFGSLLDGKCSQRIGRQLQAYLF